MAIPRRQVILHRGTLASIWRTARSAQPGDERLIADFEREFARFIGVSHAVAVASGRQGLRLILRALALPQGANVIMPAYTYRAVAQAVTAEGLAPSFVDVESQDHNMNLEQVAERAPRAGAILATHLFGNPLDMDAVNRIAEAHRLVVVEDCAHALGADYRSIKAGAWGRAGFFSFGATKLFNTFGGGMIVTSDGDLATKIRSLMAQFAPLSSAKLVRKALFFSALSSLTRPAVFSLTLYPALLALGLLGSDVISLYERLAKPTAEVGLLTGLFHPLQARWGLAGLQELPAWIEQRREAFLALDERLPAAIPRLRPIEGANPAPYFFVVMHPDRQRLIHHLLLAGIDSGHHIMDDCATMFGDRSDHPVTRVARQQSVQIPVFPWFAEHEFERIVSCLKGFHEVSGTTGG